MNGALGGALGEALGDPHKPEAILPSLTPFTMEKTNLPVTNNESDAVKTGVKPPE